MNSNLYFIANRGCDDTTYGLVSITDEDFPKFKQFIEDLNKNSYYGCMPTVAVYKIGADELKEIVYNSNAEYGDEDYVDKDDVFYLNGKTYTFANESFSYCYDLECVIDGED